MLCMLGLIFHLLLLFDEMPVDSFIMGGYLLLYSRVLQFSKTIVRDYSVSKHCKRDWSLRRRRRCEMLKAILGRLAVVKAIQKTCSLN
jgi:hypothetical protein